jgi:hypothetical protein
MKNKAINTIVVSLMIFLSIPTTAILASNNAIPGDPMYPVKTTLEKIASIFTSPAYQVHSDLEIQLIQRRIEENQALLLESGSTKGLALLVAQAEAATEYIINSNINQQTKTRTVKKLINTLEETQQVLEKEKGNLASTININSSNETSNPTISQGNSPTSETKDINTNTNSNEFTSNTNENNSLETNVSQEPTEQEAEENQPSNTNQNKTNNKSKNDTSTTKIEITVAVDQLEDLIEKSTHACKPQCVVTNPLNLHTIDGGLQPTSVQIEGPNATNTNDAKVDKTTPESKTLESDDSRSTEPKDRLKDIPRENEDVTTNEMTPKEKQLEDFLL